jgi:S1-C subfamily serine protease
VTNKTYFYLALTLMALMLLQAGTSFAEHRVRIDLERQTQKKVTVAITDFVLKDSGADMMGVGKEAKKILLNDLMLSEWFTPLQKTKFEELEKMEATTSTVDYRSWRQVGAQWLIKAEYSMVAGGKVQAFTFRLYDAVNQRFLLGKRYTASHDLFRKIIHRFADELVMYLTGTRGLAETQMAQPPQPMTRPRRSEPIIAKHPKERSLQQEVDRLTQERQLLEEEKKKWNDSRLAEENRQQPPEENSPQSGTGSGFFVSKLGHVITNAHVVKGCKKVTVGDNANKQVPAEVVNIDGSNDLALLKLSSLEMASAENKSLIQKLSIVVVPLASKGLLRSEDVRLGEKILVAGYPFGDAFSSSIKVTTGVVSSIRGVGDDSGQFQLDAAVQPGNSGGPIYDSRGNIVGVVISQLNKKTFGSLVENVNFGIKASTIKQFLISSGLSSKKAEQTEEKSTEQLAEIAQNQALMVMCLQ